MKITNHKEALITMDKISELFLCGDKIGAENELNRYGALCISTWAQAVLYNEDYAEGHVGERHNGLLHTLKDAVIE